MAILKNGELKNLTLPRLRSLLKVAKAQAYTLEGPVVEGIDRKIGLHWGYVNRIAKEINSRIGDTKSGNRARIYRS